MAEPVPSRQSNWLWRTAALVLFAFGVLPIVNWIPDGRSAPWYGTVASDWLTGSLMTVGGAVVLAILFRRWTPGTSRYSDFAQRCASAPARTGNVLGLAALVLYSVVAHAAFSGVPLHLDELAQVVQARIFASGRLTAEAWQYPEFRSALHMLDDGGRFYSQFPPGGPLLLVPGVWLGATWIVGPLLGAGSVALFWRIVHRFERAEIAFAATLLFALTPMVVFMSASHMNHSGALFFALLATWSLVRVDEGRHNAFFAGLALGALASIRPVDALAFALPAAGWLAWRARSGRRQLFDLLASGAGVAIPATGLLWYNAGTTGSATLFAYEKLWGAGHGLGFHAAPWGDAHTPALGIELVSLYFLRLQTYLFESPMPGLTLAVVGLWFARDVKLMLGYWLFCAAVVVCLYFAYWHDGFYLGPRFLYLLAPVVVLLTAQGLGAVVVRTAPASFARRMLWGGIVAAGLISVGVQIPERFSQYRTGLRVMRLDPTAPARAAGVSGALIFVRESWGAQLVPRLWALGVSRPLTEALYRLTDTCVLDERVTQLERAQQHGDAAVRALLPLMRDSARVVRSEYSPDGSERVLPGASYGTRCQRRILEDRAGFTVFLPVLTREWGSNTYARELHARDSLLVQQHPHRPIYLLRTDSLGAQLVLTRVSPDSMRAEWAELVSR